MESKDNTKRCEGTRFSISSRDEKDRSNKVMDEEDCTASAYGDVKSTAVVKFSAVEPPTRYTQLSSNTNLNQPPSNWLRGTAKLQGKWGEWTYRSSHDKIFTSFHLANKLTDCVGKVDVISDAENIKKLLKIPYGKSQISMMVHRVGKTLLLDEFDIHKHLLRASQKQFDWLRKFYFEHVVQSQEEVEHPMLRKKKTRGYLQNRNMFSKFLYYSLDDSNDENKETINVSVNPQEHPKDGLRDSLENPVQPVVSDILKETEEQVESGSHEFLRNVLWTFEDIHMLIGSDLPIFGGGTYPAVSLKLRDMKKPINVLTGLDYWLDNLMCNVPEVVMCFHVNGIVQKYELIKTEDIPQMKNSQFSPKVVKDIAQNILSFLKSNATKSGHTYWLFKGKDDDVVKLYDLTTLCADVMDEKDQNPFTLPVAMLLYRVACNIKESPEGPRKQGTIYQLLKNCLCLLNSNENPQIAMSVHYLLSEVYVPSGVNPMFVHGSCPSDESDSDDEKNEYDDQKCEDDSDNLSPDPTDYKSPSVAVNSLCRPKKCSDVFSGTDKTIPPLSKNWEERCTSALGHIIEGLKCIITVEDNEEELADSINHNAKDSPLHFKVREEKVKVAKPFQAIPLDYSPINSPDAKQNFSGVENGNAGINDSKTSAFEPEAEPSWKLCCKILLLQKAAQTYCALAEIANSNKRYGAALRLIKIGLLCYEHTPKLVASHCSKWPTEPLAYLLSLAGDVLLMLYHKNFGNNGASLQKEYDSSEQLDLDVINILERNFGKLDVSNLHYSWAWSWPIDFEASIMKSSHAYEVALEVWPEKLSDGKGDLQRRRGNVFNELGVWHMNQAIEMLKDNSLIDNAGKINGKFNELYTKSLKSLKNGIKCFELVNDVANAALLNSNIGRLMRIAARAWTPQTAEGVRKEFSSQERHYFNKAISYYNKAACILGNSKDMPEIRDTVNWELSSTLFSMACLLQDFAPLSSYAQEQVEREISELMMKALKLGEAEHPPQRIPVYQYRSAKIHHKLGSLYHNAFRNNTNDDHRRKQMRTLSDLHYAKSCTIFSSLEHCNEFFTILMERIGLWEYHLAGLSGFGSKQKMFFNIMNFMITAKPLLKSLVRTINAVKENNIMLESLGPMHDYDVSQFPVCEDDEKNERLKLLAIFYQRIQLAVVGLMNLLSAKASRNEKELKKWRKVSEFVTKPLLAENCLEEHLCSVLEQMEIIVPRRS